MHRLHLRPDVWRRGLRWKTRDAIPMLVRRSMSGELALDHFITHK